jgi:hypothetical protein
LSKSNWKDIAEFTGMVAIVLSLIFVGLQVKQSYEIAIAGQYQARHDSILTIQSMSFESDIGLRMWGEEIRMWGEEIGDGARKDESISEEDLQWIESTPAEEVGYHYLQANVVMKQFDNLHFQYRSGFLDEQSWQPYRLGLTRFLTVDHAHPNFARLIYVYQGDTEFHPAFRAEIATILQEAQMNAVN